MQSIYRDVSEFNDDDRRSLETILGHPLLPNRHVFIAVLPDLPGPSAQQRLAFLRQLRDIGAEVDAHMKRSGITAAEWESAVDTACEEVRHGKHS